MSEQHLQILICILFLFYLLPFVISQIIVSGYLRDRNTGHSGIIGAAVPVNIIINLIFLLATTCAMFRTWNPFAAWDRIIRLQCSYTDIFRLVLVNVVCTVLALAVSAVGSRVFFSREAPTQPRKLRRAVIALLIVLAAIPWSFGVSCYANGTSGLRLTAFCRKTEIETEDPDTRNMIPTDFSCAVIRNDGILTVEADQMFLGDSPDNLRGVPISIDNLPPGGSASAVMDRKTRLNVKRDGGSTVYLSNSEGRITDRLTIPALAREEIYVRTDTGWQTVPILLFLSDQIEGASSGSLLLDSNIFTASEQKGGASDHAEPNQVS